MIFRNDQGTLKKVPGFIRAKLVEAGGTGSVLGHPTYLKPAKMPYTPVLTHNPLSEININYDYYIVNIPIEP